MKNILILTVLSAVILTGCGNISPPFKAEQTTVTSTYKSSPKRLNTESSGITNVMYKSPAGPPLMPSPP